MCLGRRRLCPIRVRPPLPSQRRGACGKRGDRGNSSVPLRLRGTYDLKPSHKVTGSTKARCNDPTGVRAALRDDGGVVRAAIARHGWVRMSRDSQADALPRGTAFVDEVFAPSLQGEPSSPRSPGLVRPGQIGANGASVDHSCGAGDRAVGRSVVLGSVQGAYSLEHRGRFSLSGGARCL